jgi:uncharacterized protein (TIGR02246 family)
MPRSYAVALFMTCCVAVFASGRTSSAQTPAESRGAAPRATKAPIAPQPAGGRQPARVPAPRNEEQAIRDVADAAARFFNSGDSRSFAALFTVDGEIIDAEGNKTQGRDRIEQVFGQLFATHPGNHMDIMIDSVRPLSPTVVIEEGSSTVSNPRGHRASRNRYSVVHVKQSDGRWLMTSARDFADEAAEAKSALEDLGWLVGEWVDENPASLVKTTYAWTDNHAFLVSEFTTQVSGRVTMTGSQRIGWDPREGKIHSWVFDSEGGFAEGLWTREGDRWIVKLTGVNRDGSSASATQIIKRLSSDRYSWQSRDRIVGDDVKSDTDTLIVVRRPPGPELRELPHR